MDVVVNILFTIFYYALAVNFEWVYKAPAADGSDASSKEVKNWVIQLVGGSILALVILSLVSAYRITNDPELKGHKMVVAWWLMYSKIIAVCLLCLAALVLRSAQDSSDPSYVDTWQTVVFQAFWAAGFLIHMNLMKRCRRASYQKMLASATGKSANDQVEGGDQMGESLLPVNTTSSPTEKVSDANDLLWAIAFLRFLGSMLSISLFGWFSLKYGFETAEGAKDGDFKTYYIAKTAFFLAIAVVIKCSSIWGSKVKMFPEFFAALVFITNLAIMYENQGEDPSKYWPLYVAIPELFSVLVNTAYTFWYQYSIDGSADKADGGFCGC